MNAKLFKQGMILIMAVAIVMLSGCASIVSKSKYPVSVKSTPPGAKITVKDKKDKEVFVGGTPADFILKAGAGFFGKASYTVTFELDGYNVRTIPIEF